MPIRLLLVEDDDAIARGLCYALEQEGYAVRRAATQAAACAALPEGFDLLLLDITLPDGSGFEVLRRARRLDPDQPAVFLTARDDEGNTVLGLDLGADDYIAKPFNPMEVVARLKAQLRRAGGVPRTLLTVGDLTLDTAAMQLTQNGRPVTLTPTEYKILAQLMAAPGRIFTKVQLYEGIAGEYFESNDNTMMVHISKLREKIGDDPKNPRYIITIRGLGYKIEP